ncbi:DEAD/DEAH box helicase [Streptomyces hirsutus]
MSWLGEVVASGGSSLLVAWELLSLCEMSRRRAGTVKAVGVEPVAASPRACRVLVRNAVFRRVGAGARWPGAGPGRARRRSGGPPDAWRPRRGGVRERREFGAGPDARGRKLLKIEEDSAGVGRVWQAFAVPAGDLAGASRPRSGPHGAS